MGLLLIFGFIIGLVWAGIKLLDSVDDWGERRYIREVQEAREEHYQQHQRGEHITDGSYVEWQMTHPDKKIRDAYFEYLNEQR